MQPLNQQRVIAGQKGSETGKAVGAGVLGVVGGVVGGIYGGPLGAAQGAAAGASLGGLTGGLLDKKPTEASSITEKTFSDQIPIKESGGAMERQLSSLNSNNPHTVLNESIEALARYNDPEMTKMAGPVLQQAYSKAYNQRMA